MDMRDDDGEGEWVIGDDGEGVIGDEAVDLPLLCSSSNSQC